MVDSTKPASRSTRKCLDTVGCGIRSWRSISPTDCWDETSRLRIARRLGSAMTSNTDCTACIYYRKHMPVKEYSQTPPIVRFVHTATLDLERLAQWGLGVLSAEE